MSIRSRISSAARRVGSGISSAVSAVGRALGGGGSQTASVPRLSSPVYQTPVPQRQTPVNVPTPQGSVSTATGRTTTTSSAPRLSSPVYQTPYNPTPARSSSITIPSQTAAIGASLNRSRSSGGGGGGSSGGVNIQQAYDGGGLSNEPIVEEAPSLLDQGYSTTSYKGKAGLQGPSSLSGNLSSGRSSQLAALTQQANNIQSQLNALNERGASDAVADVGVNEEDDRERRRLEREQRQVERELADAEGVVSEATAPTGEELDVDSQLRNLLASRDLGLQEAGEQPIPLGFITGQKSAIESRAATKAMPLEARLKDLQSRRQAKLDAAKASLESVRGRTTRATTQAETRRKENREDSLTASERAYQDRVRQEGNAIDQQKFQEDVRRYGLDYAMKQQEQARLEKKFQEDVRQYGEDYALKQYQAETDRLKAESSGVENPFK